jgi:ABC-2 type transport system ATP-binding protein
VGVIEVERLRKEYRRLRGPPTLAVAGLDLDVPEGGVFGFLGPNGSGKTTTIRCLLGLVQPTAGRARLLGASNRRELAAVLPRVGSIVETPMLFPGFSGRRNLQLLGRLHGIGRRRVDAVLDQAGLGTRAGDRVRTYSLGMRQRLGLAAALLKDPAVLILDEPANGLDPAGLKEVRDLLRRLGDEGRTIFLSSHLLGEVQQICDRVAILSRGATIASGPVEEVLAQSRAAGLFVRVGDVGAGLAALADAGVKATGVDGGIRVVLAPREASRVTRILAERGLYLSELRPDVASLESVFLELTEAPPAPVHGAAPASPLPSPGSSPPRPDNGAP